MSMSAIGLINPKYPHNLGQIVRIAGCYWANRIWYTGERMDAQLNGSSRLPREERIRDYAHVKWEHRERFITPAVDEGYTPVCVEFRPNRSESIIYFEHPEKALYVFGPEDGSIPRGIATACHRFIHIPTNHCLNLSVAVSTVLYDRFQKGVPE